VIALVTYDVCKIPNEAPKFIYISDRPGVEIMIIAQISRVGLIDKIEKTKCRSVLEA